MAIQDWWKQSKADRIANPRIQQELKDARAEYDRKIAKLTYEAKIAAVATIAVPFLPAKKFIDATFTSNPSRIKPANAVPKVSNDAARKIGKFVLRALEVGGYKIGLAIRENRVI